MGLFSGLGSKIMNYFTSRLFSYLKDIFLNVWDQLVHKFKMRKLDKAQEEALNEYDEVLDKKENATPEERRNALENFINNSSPKP